MTDTATVPKTCPAFSAGGDTCPYCGAYVGELGWMGTHTPMTPHPAPETLSAQL